MQCSLWVPVLAVTLSACGEVPANANAGTPDATTAEFDASDKPDHAEAAACDEKFLFETRPGAPPSYCIPPCIWNALEACRPAAADSCIEEKQHGGNAATVCDPATGWSRSWMYGGFTSGLRQTLRSNGRVCFETQLFYHEHTTYSDAAQTTLAIGVGGYFVCGRGLVASDVFRTIQDAGPLPACSRAYFIDPTHPDCARWGAPDTPHLQCRTTEPGSCSSGLQ